jgi:hypothetical protein
MSVLEQIYADLERERAENKKLRDRLTYFDSLERELKRYWDENLIEDAWQGWDSLMDLLENQRMYEESLRRHIQKLEGQLKQLQSLLPCSICGKTDGLALNDAWIEFLREQMKKAGWGHSHCINRSKR